MGSNDETLVLTPNEVRKLLKCSRGTIYEEIRKGTIPSIHLGRKILIPRAALLKMLENAGQGFGAESRLSRPAETKFEHYIKKE